jgi:hypothetical protein
MCTQPRLHVSTLFGGGTQSHHNPGYPEYFPWLIASIDGNKSFYLVFVGVVFSQHLGLLLEQLGQYLGLLLEQLGQQHLGCFIRTAAF